MGHGLTGLAWLGLAGTLCAGSLTSPPASVWEEEAGKIVRAVAEMLAERHYERRVLDPEMADRIILGFAEQLDPNRCVFLQTDIDEWLRAYGSWCPEVALPSQLGWLTLSGELTVQREIHHRFLSRLRERQLIIEALVRRSSDLSPGCAAPGRPASSWPGDLAEAREVWRRQIDSVARSPAYTGLSPADTAASIILRYQRYLETMEMCAPRQLLQLYLCALTRAYDPHTEYIPRGATGGAEGQRVAAVAENRSTAKSLRGSIHLRDNNGATACRIAVIALPSFYAGAADDVAGQLAAWRAAPPDGLVLDLRHNGGGNLQEAISLASLFLPGRVIVQVKNREGEVSPLPDFKREPPVPGSFEHWLSRLPLLVLVNRQSASASEIVAAALQDYGRAVVVGDSTTYGKGTIQIYLPVDRPGEHFWSDPGKLKVTIKQFYRVDGRPVQRAGVGCDIVIPSSTERSVVCESALPYSIPADSVAAVRYTPVDSLAGIVHRLREGSSRRVAASGEFRSPDSLSRAPAAGRSDPSPPRTLLSETVEPDFAGGERLVAMESHGESSPGPVATRLAARSATNDDPQCAEAIRILGDYLGMIGRLSR